MGANKVIRDEVTTVRTVVTVGPVDADPLGTFGWFIGVRRRGRTEQDHAKDLSRFGACVICRRRFEDDEPIHMVFNVARNGRTVGNRLCCASCAEEHGTYHHTKTAEVERERARMEAVDA